MVKCPLFSSHLYQLKWARLPQFLSSAEWFPFIFSSPSPLSIIKAGILPSSNLILAAVLHITCSLFQLYFQCSLITLYVIPTSLLYSVYNVFSIYCSLIKGNYANFIQIFKGKTCTIIILPLFPFYLFISKEKVSNHLRKLYLHNVNHLIYFSF